MCSISRAAQYKFGIEVSVATTSRDNFVVGMQALLGIPYDSQTLQTALEEVVRLTGLQPERCYVDRGYLVMASLILLSSSQARGTMLPRRSEKS